MGTLGNLKPCVYAFFDTFLTVFPLALFLDKQRSLDTHGEQNATLARQFVNFYEQSFELLLLELALCCQWKFSKLFIEVRICNISDIGLKVRNITRCRSIQLSTTVTDNAVPITGASQTHILSSSNSSVDIIHWTASST